MKKIFTFILFAAGLTITASAQNRNDRYNNQNGYPVSQPDQNWNSRNTNQDRYPVYQPADNQSCNDQQQSTNYGYNDRRSSNDDYRRQGGYDRRNDGYDQRNDGYDRSSRYGRNRRMQPQQSNQNGKAFGTGVIVGGLAVVLLGAILSHGH